MRYRDILDYRIEVEEELLDSTILKLTLQPLVENALYHGIKTKRNGGTIVVQAKRISEDKVLLEVQDDGVGFTPYKLTQLQDSLAEELDEIAMGEGGFGLRNVHKRIQLYYGKEFGLSVQSQYRGGTHVSVTIPRRCTPGRRDV
jgi:two-component system sensor histidine kinase YesM